MEVSNTMYYNDFSLKLIEDALYELSAAKLDFGERKFVIHTGERGAMLLHKAIKQDVSGWQALGFTVNADNLGMVSKTTSPLHPNALKAGYQFTEWIGPMGLHISIQVDPWYDDPVRNKVLHSNGGVAQSYRFDIFDIGSMEQPNIQKCAIANQPEYRG